MHGLFGAVRLFVAATATVESHPAQEDDDALIPIRDGAWARWAGKGESSDPIDPLPSLPRVSGAAAHIGAVVPGRT